ncbi:ATP-binding protein [Planctomicrobium sp. SH664]|uniref:ATP-binding protein n=1 Tax=Planctomicrobium sp. SH664 TaxID=3448125 RepID=UPI003F5CB0B8
MKVSLMMSYPLRVRLTVTTVALLSLLAGMITPAWGAAFLTLVLVLLLAVSASRWLLRDVDEQHGDFVNVLKDARDRLAFGRQPLLLKSERADDSFGQVASELNHTLEQVSQKLAEVRAANLNLEQNKTLFQSILGTMMEGVLVLDSRSRVLYFNRAAREVLDCNTRNIEGRALWEVARATDLQEALESVYETGSDFRKEVEFKRSKCVVEVSVARLPLSPEPGVVVVLHEVTELRRLERLRREFVSNVSHELKTPLTSIQIYGDTLLDGGLEDVEHSRTFVTRIIEQSKRLQTLIQDMLRLARIESQSDAFQLEVLSIGPLLEECVEGRQDIARSRQVTLELIPSTEMAFVHADESGLRTIFDNLVNNALNYTPAGGRAAVCWSCDEEQITIAVEDTGIGIGADDRERIFERFYRVDRARTQGGTGLGLAIVKHLVHVFGGKIEVSSELGTGSTFRVILPRAPQPAEVLQSLHEHPSATQETPVEF